MPCCIVLASRFKTCLISIFPLFAVVWVYLIDGFWESLLSFVEDWPQETTNRNKANELLLKMSIKMV